MSSDDLVMWRQFKFWKYLSRYQFERIPIRRRYETKDVSFYTRPVPANGLLQFQRASPETEQAVVFLQPADMSAESRDQSPENDLRKIPENRMVWGVGSTSPVTTVVISTASVTTVVMFFVKAPMIWWLVTYRWYHQGHGAHASIEGGFFESKKAT